MLTSSFLILRSQYFVNVVTYTKKVKAIYRFCFVGAFLMSTKESVKVSRSYQISLPSRTPVNDN